MKKLHALTNHILTAGTQAGSGALPSAGVRAENARLGSAYNAPKNEKRIDESSSITTKSASHRIPIVDSRSSILSDWKLMVYPPNHRIVGSNGSDLPLREAGVGG